MKIFKNRKRNRILAKWVTGNKISGKEIKYLQDLFTSTEWKEGVLRLSNPKMYSLSVCSIRHHFYINHDMKKRLKPVFDQIYSKWLESMKEKGEIQDEPIQA